MVVTDFSLTPEESFLWECARTWRQPRVPDLAQINWQRLVALALHNRMPTILHAYLERAGLLSQLPPAAARPLLQAVNRYERNAAHLGHDLAEYLRFAATRAQDVVVLKGLWLSLKVYGAAHMRPGNDIDLLLRKADIPACLRILETQMGYGGWWRPLLDDRYYARHHLHQQRCNHDRSIWIEPHWLFDHPYTMLTIDYDALMQRTQLAELLGQPVRELSPPDLLLSLAIHLVKHAVYLPSVIMRPNAARIILADGMLVYFVDVAEVLRHYEGQIDWPLTLQLARAGGVADILGSVLHVCQAHLAAPVPAAVLTALAGRGPDRLMRAVMNRMADHRLDTYLDKSTSRLWAFLLGYSESIVFRPIRLLDLAYYAWPNTDFLQRRYGHRGAGVRLGHLLRVMGQYARVGIDTVYFNWRRRQEVKALDRQGFAWPIPPAQG